VEGLVWVVKPVVLEGVVVGLVDVVDRLVVEVVDMVVVTGMEGVIGMEVNRVKKL
jgi:hypothetical protein